jgi:DNA-binding transcriptional LysR family regulator
MDTRDLRYFVAAAETGHLHLAAERVGRSQPALSKCIRRLEAELNARLFEAHGRGIRLTPVGAALLDRARTLVEAMQDTIRDITGLAQGESGHVRLGTGTTAADWLLPDLLERLLSPPAGLTFQITTGLGSVLRQALREGRLDLAITPLLDSDTQDFETIAIANDVLVVAGRPNHPLARTKIMPSDLGPFRWLLPADALPSTAWLIRRLQSMGLPAPHIQVEADTVNMLQRVVARTDLLTFLSRHDLTRGDGVGLCELDLPELSLHRYLGALSLRNRYRAPAVDRVWDTLRLIRSTTLQETRPLRAVPDRGPADLA